MASEFLTFLKSLIVVHFYETDYFQQKDIKKSHADYFRGQTMSCSLKIEEIQTVFIILSEQGYFVLVG